MELEKAIEKILDGQAVLFAGAGFSYGAKNVKGEVPCAKQLKKDLLSDMGMDDNSQYGLEIIADFYKKKKSAIELIDRLREQYNILSVAEHHKVILNLQWKRVYTTNYDQVVEQASKVSANKYKRNAIILSDDFEATNKTSICIHINGYIDRINEDKLDNEFKLTDKSYSCDTLIGNPWFEFMVNDFEAASVIIIIGYSMQFDIDIKRLLSAPQISQKVIFIDVPEIDEISKGLLENYGDCHPIGIKEFGKRIKEIKKDYIPSMDSPYKSFKCMYRDTLTSILPNYEEIVRFYTEGKACDKIFAKDSSGEYKYILNRKAITYFLRNYRNNKVFLALSHLGNGKTVFLNMVENELRKEDVKVYTYVHRYDSIESEIEAICNESKKQVVIIDNYPGHMEILNKFAKYGHRNITFLLSARNGVNLMFRKQLEKALHIDTEDICPLYLDQIQDDTEINDLATILENNSLLTESVCAVADHNGLVTFIKHDCHANFSNLLLRLFEASSIKEKLEKLYGDLEKTEKTKVKEVAIFALLKNISNYDVNFNEILDLFSADYIALKKNEIEFIPEIFVDDSGINVRSSIISMSLIRNVIKLEDIISAMKKAFLAADDKQGKTYKELQKSMVSHSQFIFFANVPDERERYILIESFYNDIRNTKFAKHNIFFWEQFASAYIDMKKYDLVKKCIDNALIESKKTKGFVPFQVKTVQGRYFVEKCYDDLLNGKCSEDEAIEAIVNATEAILMYYSHPENNQYYVFKVVRKFSDIFLLVKDSLEKRAISIYIEKASILNKHMERYIAQDTFMQDYVSKIKRWQQELSATIDDAKTLLK